MVHVRCVVKSVRVMRLPLSTVQPSAKCQVDRPVLCLTALHGPRSAPTPEHGTGNSEQAVRRVALNVQWMAPRPLRTTAEMVGPLSHCPFLPPLTAHTPSPCLCLSHQASHALPSSRQRLPRSAGRGVATAPRFWQAGAPRGAHSLSQCADAPVLSHQPRAHQRSPLAECLDHMSRIDVGVVASAGQC